MPKARNPIASLALVLLSTMLLLTGMLMLSQVGSIAKANSNVVPCIDEYGIWHITPPTIAYRTHRSPDDFYCEKIPNGVRVHTRAMVFFDIHPGWKIKNLRVLNLFCASVDPAVCASKPKTAKITFRIYKYGAPGGKEYDCTIPVDGVGHYKLEYSKYVPPHLIPTVPVFGVSFNRLCANAVENGDKTVVVIINKDSSSSGGLNYSERWFYDGHFTFDVVKE